MVIPQLRKDAVAGEEREVPTLSLALEVPHSHPLALLG